MPVKIAVFQHDPAEPLGCFRTVFDEKNVPYEYVRLFETGEVPRTDATHFIFMGGSMSVNDEREYPYLQQEKQLIRTAVKKRMPVLGICLGAQLIASAFGARVYPFVKETGWYMVEREQGCADVFRQLPGRFCVFQLHGETFELPFGAWRLCCGERVKNQAFAYRSALALQFHLELTDAIMEEWIRDMKKYTREKIARETPRYLAESNRLCRIIAEDFLAR
jgi:GMP synthase-like glutamine amidotransferase